MLSVEIESRERLVIDSSSMRYRVPIAILALLGAATFLVSGGIAVFSGSSLAIDLSSTLLDSGVPAWVLALVAASGLMMAGIASVPLFSFSALRVEFDAASASVSFHERGSRMSMDARAFVSCGVVERELDGNPVYHVALMRRNGAFLPVYRTRDGGGAERVAAVARAILGLPPSFEGAPDFPAPETVVLPRLAKTRRRGKDGFELVVRTPRNPMQLVSGAMLLAGFAWIPFSAAADSLGPVGAWIAQALAISCGFYWVVALLASLAGSGSLEIDSFECVARHKLFGVALPFGVTRVDTKSVVAAFAGFSRFDNGLWLLDRDAARLYAKIRHDPAEASTYKDAMRRMPRLDVTALGYSGRLALENLVARELRRFSGT